jgi:hypothetical protein
MTTLFKWSILASDICFILQFLFIITHYMLKVKLSIRRCCSKNIAVLIVNINFLFPLCFSCW